MIVYGANCIWWDSIEKCAVYVSNRLPCCPFCGGVLFQMEDNEWFNSIENYDRSHSGYSDFMRWQRGKCFKTYEEGVRNYELHGKE